jgi:hypothetical protein
MSEIEGVALPYNGRRSTEWIDGLYWMSHALRQDARPRARMLARYIKREGRGCSKCKTDSTPLFNRVPINAETSLSYPSGLQTSQLKRKRFFPSLKINK